VSRRGWGGAGAVTIGALALLAAAGRLGAVALGETPAAALTSTTAQPALLPARLVTPPAVPAAVAPVADPRAPTAPPADVSWQVWHTLALPWSRSAGPTLAQGDAVGGFAHTPTGALLAAVQAAGRKVAATDAGWRQVAATMLAPGPGRDAWQAARARATLATDPPAGTFAQVAGFQFLSYTPDDAVVQLVTRGVDGGFGVVGLHVVWQDGDWRLVLAPDGGDATSQQRAASLAGFVAWGGV